MRASMPEERVTSAIDRIERALARIETASARSRPAPPADDGELRALRDTHRALRARVEAAIRQIDRLLAGREER